jgi:hypothetical protein
MKKVPHLYLDMDGVQADFFSSWAKWHGLKIKNPEIQRYKQIGDRSARQDSIEDMKRAGPEFVFKFFATLPELGGGMRLLHWIVQNKIPCTILTAPLGDPDADSEVRNASIEGKKYWLEHHNPHFPVIFESDKYKYANTDGVPNVLVDDFKKYVNAWRDHGGIAILHRDHTTDDTLAKLKEIYAPYLKKQKALNTSVAKDNTMNKEPDYLEEAYDDGEPCAGDVFEFELGDMLIETTIAETLEDGVVIHLDETAMKILVAAARSGIPQQINEAKYQGRTVPLGKPMKGDVKKSKVYVKNAKGNVVKVNFGDKNMRIKKNIPGRRKNFRARHHCENPGPRWKARYWSCRAW